MMLVLTLQNLVAYSVNMADNLMLGSYSQNALSGAATVNQIFFMVQQFALAFGNALVVLASQYWGENRKEPIRVLTGIALKAGLFCGIVIVVLCTVMPKQLLGLFTNAPEIINQGLGYLNLLKWTFAFYIITNILMAGKCASYFWLIWFTEDGNYGCGDWYTCSPDSGTGHRGDLYYKR